MLNTLFEWISKPSLIRLLVIILLAFIILTTAFLIKKGINKSSKSTNSKYKARKGINLLSYILLVILTLIVYSEKLGSIGVALGVAGAGIAFALQEVIVSIAGWFGIIVSGKISIGDRVEIGSVKGDIIDISITSTTVMELGGWVNGDLYNGRIVTLANSFFFKEPIHNYSAEYPFLWDEVAIPIKTGSDHQLARQLFEKILIEICVDYSNESEKKWNSLTNKYQVEEAQVKPMVSMRFDENWITFSLRYVVDFKKRRSTKDYIFTKVLEELSNYSDKIFVATSTLEITSNSDS